mgnify:CR=1 FL=1|tara:strand:+ start:380 stop:1312 length:933 start_codon:yes stop_codon:yes gene_type:complete
MLQRILLGPQLPTPNLATAIDTAHIPDGPIAVITAAWQEAEADTEELQQQLQRPIVSLDLYQRAEAIFADDEKLRTAYRARQDQLQELQQLYRTRLRQSMIAARKMRRIEGSSPLLAIERQHATEQLRDLDAHHSSRIQAIFDEYAHEIIESSSALLKQHRDEIENAMAGCSTVLITGGNVLVLLNRLQLFEMQSHLASRHLVAWSAGAMVLSDTIVLYHDRTPLGRRDPEVLGPGLGIIPNLIFLPDAKKRLQDKDRARVGIFSDRFAPGDCITLNNGSLFHFDEKNVHRVENAHRLSSEGDIQELHTT